MRATTAATTAYSARRRTPAISAAGAGGLAARPALAEAAAIDAGPASPARHARAPAAAATGKTGNDHARATVSARSGRTVGTTSRPTTPIPTATPTVCKRRGRCKTHRSDKRNAKRRAHQRGAGEKRQSGGRALALAHELCTHGTCAAMCAKCAHDFKPPRATARLCRRRATPLADISNGRLDSPLRDPTGATGADQCRAVGRNGDCRVLRLSRHSRNTRHHVSRMRCSAERLRSGAPLIRDRHGLERSRVCSAPLRAALRPGHEITRAAPGPRDRMPCAGRFPPTERIFA